MSKYVIAGAMGALMISFSAVDAFAAYACSGNVCWTVKERYTYPAESKVIVREDSWKPGPEVTIREPGPGRGYYVGGDWRTW